MEKYELIKQLEELKGNVSKIGIKHVSDLPFLPMRVVLNQLRPFAELEDEIDDTIRKIRENSDDLKDEAKTEYI